MAILGIAAAVLLVLELLNILSYRVLKRRILRSRRWGLNICCGATDGGGVNADIFKHRNLPNFVKVDDVCHLPFADNQFDSVLCSHTMEHVDEPDLFYTELKRVGREVTIVLPPLWDVFGQFCLWQHKWIFFTFRKIHTTLPPRVRLPLSRTVQRLFGQKVVA
jgi:SAM-dependent methyltransferase